MIGSVEALEVLMGFHQHRMTRQVIFLRTELVPTQIGMLKPRVEIESLPEDDEDIYLKTKFETYLQRPTQLAPPMYPEFYRWWRSATPAQQKKAVSMSACSIHNMVMVANPT